MLSGRTALVTGSTQGIGLAIAQALAQIGGTAGVPPLLRMLKAKDGIVQVEAISALGALRAKEAVDPLIAKAQEKAVVVTFDRDIVNVPTNSCFENIALVDERTLEITYRKDRVNAGEVLTALAANGLAIVDVTTRDPDLEDVFLSLVAGNQDAA